MAYVIREVVEVDASPAVVWRHLVDLPGWSAWNHLSPQAVGVPEAGGTMRLVIPGPLGLRVPSAVCMEEVTPEHALVWSGSLPVPGLFAAVHGFDLEALPGGRTRIVHHETFRGLLVRPLLWLLGARGGARHRAVNEALKAVVEAS